MTAPAVTDETTTEPVETVSEAVETTEQAPVADRGDGRNERGQFVSKTANEVANEQEAEAAAAPPPEPLGTAASPETVAAGPTTEAAPAPEPTPYAIRALGQQYAMEGAQLAADGSVIFTPEGRNQLERLFGRAVTLHQREQTIQQQRAELKAQRAADQAELKVLVEEVWNKLTGAQTLEQFQEIAAELMLNKQVIEDRRALAKDRAVLAVQTEKPEVSPVEYQAAVEQDLEDSLKETLQALQQAPWAKGLTQQDWRRLADNAYRVRGQFVQARENRHFYDPTIVEQYVQEQASWILDERKKVTATARDAQSAERKNAAAGVSAVKAPPAIGASAPPGNKPVAPKAQQVTPSKPKSYSEREAERQAELRALNDWVQAGDR